MNVIEKPSSTLAHSGQPVDVSERKSPPLLTGATARGTPSHTSGLKEFDFRAIGNHGQDRGVPGQDQCQDSRPDESALKALLAAVYASANRNFNGKSMRSN